MRKIKRILPGADTWRQGLDDGSLELVAKARYRRYSVIYEANPGTRTQYQGPDYKILHMSD